jgi:hypothetical protein
MKGFYFDPEKFSSSKKKIFLNSNFRNLSYSAKGLYNTLRICPEMNVLGVFIKDKRAMIDFFSPQEQKDGGKCLEMLNRDLAELRAAELLYYQDRLVIIKDFLKEFPISDSSKNILHALRVLAAVFDDCSESGAALLESITYSLYDCIQNAAEPEKLFVTVFDTAAETLGKPFLHFGLEE